MAPVHRLLRATLFLFGLAGTLLVHAQQSAVDSLTNLVSTPATNVLADSLPPANGGAVSKSTNQIPLSPQAEALRDAARLSSQGNLDDALDKVNAILLADPKNINAYNLRGSIYTKKQLWDQARKDYEAILQIDGQNVVAKFNLSEIKFMQKLYDDARPGFLALEKDPDLGDLATYKVFLCDLFGGHADLASQELDALNQVGSNPSYYFGNVAWELYHKRPEAARPWLQSAVRIYYPYKVENYSSSLKELGYLPLPPPPT